MDTLGSIPFTDQINLLIQKIQTLLGQYPTPDPMAKNKAQVVITLLLSALLTDLRSTITKFNEGSLALADLKTRFDALMAKYGWVESEIEDSTNSAWRARLIAEINLRGAYSAGRWKQQIVNKNARPYLIYRHSDAVEIPRPVHMTWDRLVLPIDHPWWKTHYPPGGFGCQCQAFSLSEQELRSLGLAVTPDHMIPPGEMDSGWGRV